VLDLTLKRPKTPKFVVVLGVKRPGAASQGRKPEESSLGMRATTFHDILVAMTWRRVGLGG
jgi:hypothetical protein